MKHIQEYEDFLNKYKKITIKNLKEFFPKPELKIIEVPQYVEDFDLYELIDYNKNYTIEEFLKITKDYFNKKEIDMVSLVSSHELEGFQKVKRKEESGEYYDRLRKDLTAYKNEKNKVKRELKLLEELKAKYEK